MDKPRMLVQVSRVMNACDYYRGYMPIKELDEHDAISARIVHGFGLLDAYGADQIVVFRPRDPAILNIIEPAKWQGCEILGDFDDDIFGIPESNYCAPNFGPNEARMAGEISSKVFSLSASTPRLATRLQKFNPNVCVIPNVIDWGRAMNMQKGWEKPKKDAFHIVWAGSVTHVEDQEIVVAPIRQLLKKYEDVYVTFFGWAYNKLVREFPGKVSYHPMVDFFHYLRVLRDMNPDVVIQPLVDHPFNYCKSNIRWLEAGIFGFPCIASDVPSFEMLTDNFCPTVAWNEIDWYDRLEWAYKNPEELAEIGARSKKAIQKHWSIETMWTAWNDYFIAAKNREKFVYDYTPDMKKIWQKEFASTESPAPAVISVDLSAETESSPKGVDSAGGIDATSLPEVQGKEDESKLAAKEGEAPE